MSTDCGCGDSSVAPATIHNRAGLRTIDYRSGTWAEFRARMFDALSTVPELGALRTRSTDDFTIALLDAWAVVCDILTFYQERIANESYLRTATETLSVGELAKLIGFKLRPGLAASAALAFTLDVPLPLPSAPNTPPTGSPAAVVLPVGTRGQTVPDPTAQPATFETVGPITARGEWNAIRLRTRYPAYTNSFDAGANVRLDGMSTGVRAGDLLLVTGPLALVDSPVSQVTSVEVDDATQTSLVHFVEDQSPMPQPDPTTPGTATPGAVLGDAFVWDSVRDHAWVDQGELVAFALAQGWSIDELEQRINALRSLPSVWQQQRRAFELGIRAAVFGHNAVDWNSLSKDMQGVYANWNNLSVHDVSSDGWSIDLDGTYQVAVGDRVVLVDPTAASQFVTTIARVGEVTSNRFLLSGKSTRIRLDSWPPGPAAAFKVRSTRVLIQSAELPVADLIDENVVSGGLTLDAAYLTLAVGQLVAVTGIRRLSSLATASEVATITGLQLVDGRTRLTLSPALTGGYELPTVTVNANVAAATHGETTSEIVGSGDATVSFQRFALRQPPLTYISAATASGSASTLTVRVDGVAWTEVDWLATAAPTDRVFTVLAGVDGKTYLQFGDGATGARPGTGANNIVATYRHGIGSAGRARAGQISTLLTRPLGLKAVTNPLATIGAADPETLVSARANAPITVRALGRIVSLEDVGDFAAASAGIAKAGVDWIWDGARYVACATVAGIGGATIPPGADQYRNLLQAMRDAGDGTLAVALCSYVPVSFGVAATVTSDPARVSTEVLAAVKAALANAFGFDERAFGQPVFASEVIEVIQSVPGVVAMTLDGLNVVGQPLQPPLPSIAAAAPSIGGAGLVGAVLLTIDPGRLPDVVMATP